MSAGAIIMMCIACVGLWGGFAASVAIAFKHRHDSPEDFDEK